MSLEIFISSRAEQDMTLQYRWYLENADLDVAERYLLELMPLRLNQSQRDAMGERQQALMQRLRSAGLRH